MATCDKCGRTMNTVFEKDGEWLCRNCYPKAVLTEKEAKEFDEENSEKLADALYDDYWRQDNRVTFRRVEDE